MTKSSAEVDCTVQTPMASTQRQVQVVLKGSTLLLFLLIKSAPVSCWNTQEHCGQAPRSALPNLHRPAWSSPDSTDAVDAICCPDLCGKAVGEPVQPRRKICQPPSQSWALCAGMQLLIVRAEWVHPQWIRTGQAPSRHAPETWTHVLAQHDNLSHKSQFYQYPEVLFTGQAACLDLSPAPEEVPRLVQALDLRSMPLCQLCSHPGQGCRKGNEPNRFFTLIWADAQSPHACMPPRLTAAAQMRLAASTMPQS